MALPGHASTVPSTASDCEQSGRGAQGQGCRPARTRGVRLWWFLMFQKDSALAQWYVAGYIPSNIISMTDGQIYFSATLFGEGFKPAIDMGLSVSRIGNRVQWSAMKKSTGMLQLEFVRYREELERLTRIKAGVSSDVERRLRKGRVVEEILKQDANQPVPMEEQVIALMAFQSGFFDKTEPAEVRGKLARLTKQLRANCPALLEEMVRTQKLTDGVKEGINQQFARYADSAV